MIKRYECITEWSGDNLRATLTDDGPWVSYDDHAEAMQKLWQTADTRERMNSQTIATLRDQITRRDKEISDLRHEIESARDAARGENALRLEAERERMNGQIQNSRSIATLCSEIERWVKEVAHLKLAAEKTERERMREELTFE